MGATHSSSRSVHGSTVHNSKYNTVPHVRRKGRSSFSKDRLHPQTSTQQRQYLTSNSSGSALHTSNHLQPPSPCAYYGHPQYQQHHPGSYSPPSSNTSHTSSLHKAISRRRSSNQTVESMSSGHCSTLGSTPNSSMHDYSRHSGESDGHPQDDHEFRWLHGRRYHNTSSLYMLPNDTEEVDRLHLQHYIFKMILGGKNLHVPLSKETGRVIDLGCGPATWTMDMATEMTAVNFVGVDISPIYPTAIHPRNCCFYREDILRGVSQPDGCFDVAYQRNVAPGFTVEHWQQAINEAYRLLKPGGWFESVESDVSIQEAGPFTNMCYEYMRMSMASRNVDPSVVRTLDRMMVQAGFKDVQVKEYCVPLGEWGGKLGQLWKQNMVAILDTVKPHFVKTGRSSELQVAEMMHGMIKETQEVRAYQTIYVTFGRKPL
ncbi:unnamed protein product [Mortierella alpina]